MGCGGVFGFLKGGHGKEGTSLTTGWDIGHVGVRPQAVWSGRQASSWSQLPQWLWGSGVGLGSCNGSAVSALLTQSPLQPIGEDGGLPR